MGSERAIGVDLGLKRVGVAIGDEATCMARPLGVLPYEGQDNLAACLTEMARANDAATFVVGLPRNMDGSMGESARRSVKFARKLSNQSGLPVVLADERLTTSQAQKEMIALGKSRSNRRMTVDQVAAVLILENYLRQKAILGQSEGQ